MRARPLSGWGRKLPQFYEAVELADDHPPAYDGPANDRASSNYNNCWFDHRDRILSRGRYKRPNREHRSGRIGLRTRHCEPAHDCREKQRVRPIHRHPPSKMASKLHRENCRLDEWLLFGGGNWPFCLQARQVGFVDLCVPGPTMAASGQTRRIVPSCRVRFTSDRDNSGELERHEMADCSASQARCHRYNNTRASLGLRFRANSTVGVPVGVFAHAIISDFAGAIAGRSRRSSSRTRPAQNRHDGCTSHARTRSFRRQAIARASTEDAVYRCNCTASKPLSPALPPNLCDRRLAKCLV